MGQYGGVIVPPNVVEGTPWWARTQANPVVRTKAAPVEAMAQPGFAGVSRVYSRHMQREHILEGGARQLAMVNRSVGILEGHDAGKAQGQVV